MCGKDKIEEDFYQTNSVICKFDKKMSICKDCIVELYEDFITKNTDIKIAMYHTCRYLDIYFEHNLVESVIQNIKNKTPIIRMYVQKVNSLPQYKLYDFSNSDNLEISNKTSSNNEKFVDLLTYEVTPQIIRTWGGGYKKEEYVFLEELHNDLLANYDSSSPIQKILLKEISKTMLAAENVRENPAQYEKMMNVLRNLMTDLNIKPVQETGANALEQATFGNLVKKWENERPIPEPEDEFKDVDGIAKYIKTWFTGHFAKMINMEDNSLKMYEEEILKHTVSLTSEENGCDD